MPYFSPLTDTLMVNGLDLQAIPGVIVENLDGVHSPGTRRGTNDTIPNRRGQLGSVKPLDAYAFSVPITLIPAGGSTPATLATQRGIMLNTLRVVTMTLMTGGGLVTLVRRLTLPSGSTYDTTARGEFVDGLAMSLLNAETGRTELQFVNLDGCWYDATDATVTPGAVSGLGHIPTRRIMITLPSAGTLTNTTTGASVSVTTACVLDVTAFTATAGIATLTSTGDSHWFVINPGPNTITWTGTGTPTMAYRAAYL